MSTIQTPMTTAMPQQDLYRVLSIPQTASPDEIKKAIIQGSRLWSNRTNAPQIEKRQEAERIVKLIDEAEAILLDPAKRAAYDRQLATASTNKHEVDEDDLKDKDDLVGEAWRLLSDGDIPDALFVAEKATQKEGSNPEAWAVLGQAKARWGEIEDAIYEYKKAIKLKPNEASFYFDLGTVYETADRLDEAMNQYQKAAQVDPRTPMYRAAVAGMLLRAGESRSAIGILEQCVAEEPDNAPFQRYLAIAYVDSSIDNWTAVSEDSSGFLPPGVYATAKAQVVDAQSFIEKAERIKVDDDELRTHIIQRRADIDKQLKRRFYGSYAAPIIGAIIWIFFHGVGLVLGPLYFFAARPPQYAISKRLLKRDVPLSAKFLDEGILATVFQSAIIGVFLPIMILWNFIKNYTGENSLPPKTK